METIFIEHFALLSDAVVVTLVVIFVGIFSSKYYEMVKLVNENQFYAIFITLSMGTLFLSKYLVSIGNLSALFVLHFMFHGSVLVSLVKLNRKFLAIKLTYERQRNFAYGCNIAAWIFEMIAIVATVWWLYVLNVGV